MMEFMELVVLDLNWKPHALALVSFYGRRVPGSLPQMLCHRRFPLDSGIRTGWGVAKLHEALKIARSFPLLTGRQY
jgi:hypothetical protein